MFHNVGKKIKVLAQVMFYIMLVGAVIGGVALISSDDELVPVALGVIAGGALFAWIGSVFIYGFGELIDSAQAIEFNTRSDKAVSPIERDQIEKRRRSLDTLLAQGLITEEEYKNAISNGN
ncbi:MAG: hypothetical protein IKL62_04945 [Clostridia bacterium]|nr:hypothetical protein [Clostridia bacterium]